MKCPKCGLDPDEGHSAEFYSGCRRCTMHIQRSRLRQGMDWRLEEGNRSQPLTSDCFCVDCGKLLIAPGQLCLVCESRRRTSGG